MGARDRVLSVHQTGASPSSDMASEGKGSAIEGWWHHLSTWFDIEITAVVTILLGVFQLLLCASLIQTDQIMSQFFFILPLVLGAVMITGGSFTMASKMTSSNLLLRGCAVSNGLGLLGSLLGFCIYSYTLANPNDIGSCVSDNYRYNLCPEEKLEAYSWSLTIQLLLYDAAAVVTSFLLSVCAFKALKQTNTQT